MATTTIPLRAGLFAIHAIGGDEIRPFIGNRAECIRHALKTDDDPRHILHSSILKHLPTPDWWLLQTVEDWAIHQLPVDYPGVIELYLAEQGREQQAKNLVEWVDDWLLNGEKSRRTMHTLFEKARLYLHMLDISIA
jgi:hypothetical protein